MEIIVISMLFASQIILLVFGIGVGYWLLVISNSQGGYKKTTGEVLGWILIGATLALTLGNFIYSMKIVNSYNVRKYCPINPPMHQQGGQVITPEDQGMPGAPQKEERPIKDSSNDYD